MKQVSVLPTFAQVLEAVAEARKKYADQIRAARAEGGKTQGSKSKRPRRVRQHPPQPKSQTEVRSEICKLRSLISQNSVLGMYCRI
jgi:hypothetical protein